jgi:ribosomal protein S8E
VTKQDSRLAWVLLGSPPQNPDQFRQQPTKAADVSHLSTGLTVSSLIISIDSDTHGQHLIDKGFVTAAVLGIAVNKG